MKVTLITVTYNAARFLADCIQSVVRQTYPNIEYLVIDGKSTDQTLNVIQAHEKHITKWISEPDRGMYDAINKGMKMATGDVIGILNADDVLASPDVIASIVRTFEESGADSVYGDLVYVDQTNTSKVIRYWKGFEYKRYRFLYGWMPAHPTFYIKRSLVEQYGGYESHYFTAADYEFMARYLYTHRISAKYLPKMIARMRTGGQSNKTLKARIRANRRDYLAMKRNNIPLPLAASVLKPLIKLHQYYYTFFYKGID